MTIFRISPQDGSEEEIQMRQVRKGDVFYTCDGNNKGPLLQAGADADQRPQSRKPGQFVWGCKAEFASLEIRLALTSASLAAKKGIGGTGGSA